MENIKLILEKNLPKNGKACIKTKANKITSPSY